MTVKANVDNIVTELDRLYIYDVDKYVDECKIWKQMGYKILRNSEGQHKVIEPARPDDAYGDNDIYNAFGGIFGQIFGKNNN